MGDSHFNFCFLKEEQRSKLEELMDFQSKYLYVNVYLIVHSEDIQVLDIALVILYNFSISVTIFLFDYNDFFFNVLELA